MAKQCTHLDHIHDVTPSAQGCEDCLKTGDSWVHLRICLECGHVGCCDSSKNKHAIKHFHATNHPIIQSFQPGRTGAGAISTRCCCSAGSNIMHIFAGQSEDQPGQNPEAAVL